MLTRDKEVNMKQTAIPITGEEKANMQLLEITDGMVIRVTDPDKLIGSLVLPEGITEIGMFAFAHCSGLTSIIIPDSVTKIGQGAFACCFGLSCITIPCTVTEIADEVFFWNGLIHIVIPDTVIKIGKDAFSDCSSLTSVIIPHSVAEIGDEAFFGCTNLKTVIIESAIIKHIGVIAFENVHTDVHFTVKTDDVKALLKKSSTIRDEQIMVKPNL